MELYCSFYCLDGLYRWFLIFLDGIHDLYFFLFLVFLNLHWFELSFFFFYVYRFYEINCFFNSFSHLTDFILDLASSILGAKLVIINEHGRTGSLRDSNLWLRSLVVCVLRVRFLFWIGKGLVDFLSSRFQTQDLHFVSFICKFVLIKLLFFKLLCLSSVGTIELMLWVVHNRKLL